MNVGFFCMAQAHLDMAKLLVESVRRSMPHAKIHHLTDDRCPTLPGLDSTRVLAGNYPMAIRRMLHHARCDGEWLFVDSDIVIQKDVSDVFNEPFDVALTDREGTITNEVKFAEVMPHNIGVVFSRSPKFWETVAANVRRLAPQQQEWMGDQIIVNAMVKQGGHGFNIKTIPGSVYNYPPKSATDDLSNAAIVHYKGNRKQWLLEKDAAEQRTGLAA